MSLSLKNKIRIKKIVNSILRVKGKNKAVQVAEFKKGNRQ